MQKQRLTSSALVLAMPLLLLVVPGLSAGDRVHAPSHPSFRAVTSTAPAPVAHAAFVQAAAPVSVVVATPVAATARPFTIDLRGPDGQTRRFAVEGGQAAIQYRQVILLPGQQLTIHWMPTK